MVITCNKITKRVDYVKCEFGFVSPFIIIGFWWISQWENWRKMAKCKDLDNGFESKVEKHCFVLELREIKSAMWPEQAFF